MPNAWILFVKEYAKKHNITYGCAISKAKDDYKAHKAGKSIPTKIIEQPKPVITEPVKVPRSSDKKIETIKISKTPKIIQNAVISKKEKKAILDELTTNLNALKKQQTRIPSQSRSMEISKLEKRIMEVAGI